MNTACVGTSNHYSALQAALDAVHAQGGGEVIVTTPTEISQMITLYADVRLRCLAPIAISANFVGGVALRENSAAAHGLELIDLQLDLSAKADVGGVHIYQGDGVRLIRPHITGQRKVTASKWTLRVGNYINTDPAGTASTGLYIEDPVITNCDAGTYEQMLIVNQQDYDIVRPVFNQNINQNAYELMCYINNQDGRITSPTFNSPNAHSIGVMESDGISITGVNGVYTQNYKVLTIINSQNVTAELLNVVNTTVNPTAPIIDLFDRQSGPDGFAQLIEDTNNVEVKIINAVGWKHVGSLQLVDTSLGTIYTMGQHHIKFSGNITGTASTPFILGANSINNNLHDFDFTDVTINSWAGSSVGAFQLRGYANNPAQMCGFRFSNCFVRPSSTTGSNAAIRAIGMTVESIANSDLRGTYPGYGMLSTVSGGVIPTPTQTLSGAL